MSEKKTGKGIIIVAFLLSIAIVCGIWGFLIKTNKFINLGEKLRPYIKDIPVVCLILPELSLEVEPSEYGRPELENLYKEVTSKNKELEQKNSDLEEEVIQLRDYEEKYNILLKEVASLKEIVAAFEAKNSEEATQLEKITSLVKVYEAMEAAEAASILEEMGTLNINLVMEICKNMKSATFSSIMQEMNTDFAAILSERMIEE